MELNDKKFAVLVDADNISHRKIKDILDEIANYGTPTIKRIYGDFTNPKFAAWKEVLLENSITPIQQYAYTTGKNATDSALIIDAMDILHKEGVDGFCIVSSDSDYTRLASRIRESGREVLGFGEKKTPKPFIKSCDKFIYVEILGQTPPEKAAPAKKKADAKRSAGAEAPVGPAAETAGETASAGASSDSWDSPPSPGAGVGVTVASASVTEPVAFSVSIACPEAVAEAENSAVTVVFLFPVFSSVSVLLSPFGSAAKVTVWDPVVPPSAFVTVVL